MKKKEKESLSLNENIRLLCYEKCACITQWNDTLFRCDQSGVHMRFCLWFCDVDNGIVYVSARKTEGRHIFSKKGQRGKNEHRECYITLLQFYTFQYRFEDDAMFHTSTFAYRIFLSVIFLFCLPPSAPVKQPNKRNRLNRSISFCFHCSILWSYTLNLVCCFFFASSIFHLKNGNVLTFLLNYFICMGRMR